MTPKFNPPLEKRCTIGDWHFNPVDGSLKSKHENVRLQPRLCKLLAIFAANTDTLLTREVLIDYVWQEKAVNEDALSRCVAELRSTLGDNRNTPIYIQTVPKKGYRFIHPISENHRKKFTLGFMAVTLLLASILLFSLTPREQNVSQSVDKAIRWTQSLKDAIDGAQRITADKAFEYLPRLSSKGDKIAFSSIQDERLIIKIVSAKGELLHEIRAPDKNFYSATFSPEGNSLLVAGISQGQCTVYLYLLPTLENSSLGDCIIHGANAIFDFSPDGSQFAYVAPANKIEGVKGASIPAIWIHDLKRKQKQQVTFPSSLSGFDSHPKYSPDGTQLAFTRGGKSFRDIFVTKLNETQATTQLTDNKSYVTSFDWLSDGQHLVYDSDQMGDRNLWLFDIKFGNQHLLGARNAQFVSLNSNSTMLAYRDTNYDANIWQVNLNDNEAVPSRIIESIKYNNFPAFSPDGETIAFTTNRSGKGAIWLHSTTTSQQRKLLSLPELNLLAPKWSQDGKKLLAGSRGNAGYRCYQIDLVTAEYQSLEAITFPHDNCRYSNNGDIFAVAKQPDQSSKLLKLKQDGELQELTQWGISRFEVTDKDTLIYSLPEKKGLYSMDFFGQNIKPVIEDFKPSLDAHWTVRGSSIYYPASEGQVGIWRLDLATGENKIVTQELPSAVGLTIDVSPDHSKLLLTKTDNAHSDIYLSKIVPLEK